MSLSSEIIEFLRLIRLLPSGDGCQVESSGAPEHPVLTAAYRLVGPLGAPVNAALYGAICEITHASSVMIAAERCGHRLELTVISTSHGYPRNPRAPIITRMKRTLTPAAAAAVLLALAACSNSKTDSSTNSAAEAAVVSTLSADDAFTTISSQVRTAKLSGAVTPENDPNHLLGRASQYTSKITFTDSRISAADVDGTGKRDIERGGAIEVFADPADAKARADYIQGFAKSTPTVAEYDYVHGAVLVRVSRDLTPAQAAAYKTAANRLS
ncbi:hypothetical protein ABZX69_14415 [Streptomyces sp. NPDC004074]|uniref:hypothetical protein n=1 Tax=unclassified Streptomyces TaxID=2593676 RepID=UPI00339EC9B6